MAEIRLAAEPRAEQGSAASRRLRRSGRVPGVLYGHGTGPVSLSVDARQLRAALTTGGSTALFDLEVGDDVHLAIAREVQQHPVRRTVAHVDFQLVARDELVPAEVPIVLVGESVEVGRAGGTIEHVVPTLTVRAVPADLPQAIELDVSGLAVGDALRFSALRLPEGVHCDLDPETVLVVAAAPHAAPAADEAEAGEGPPAGYQGAASAGGSEG